MSNNFDDFNTVCALTYRIFRTFAATFINYI